MISEKKSSVTGVRTRVKLVPPDGGWGWMVVIGSAASFIFNQSLLSLFSLLYGDALEAMGHTTQGAAFVLSIMLFVSSVGGPLVGALINLTSPRIVALLGSVFSSAGIFLSAFATNIWHLAFGYGILVGLGIGFIQTASFVAINSYFKLRKSQAVGIANAGSGVGQTVMPYVVGYLLENYGFRSTCLILSALSLNGVAGSLLIQPVRRHMKEIIEEIPEDEAALLNGKHKDIVIEKETKDNVYVGPRRAIEPSVTKGEEVSQHFTELKRSLSSLEIHTVPIYEKENGVNGKNNQVPEEPKKSVFKRLYDFLDISLLTSPRFINILFGLALSLTSIMSFTMIYPLFLQKVAMMDKQQTAMCMSAVAIADIVGRVTLPVLQDKYKIKARLMIALTCVWVIVFRQMIVFQTNLYALIVTSLMFGLGKSVFAVSRNIAIADNCRPEQVPAAVGLGMLTMGVILPPVSYLLGWIRDYTESYILCITAQNILVAIVLVAWIPDMILLHFKEKQEKKKENQQLQLS